MALAAKIEQIKPVPASVQFLEKQVTAADPEVRGVGVDSIPKIKAPAEPLTDLGKRLLEHENWYIRQTAADLLCKSCESEGAAELATRNVLGGHLTDADAEVRRCAARGLVGIAVAALALPNGSEEADEGLPGSAAAKAAATRKAAAVAAKSVASEHAEAAAEAAAEQLSSPDPLICANAVEALSRMGDFAAPHAAALGACIGNPDLGVRNAVISAVGRLGKAAEKAAGEVAQQLQHGEQIVRRGAKRALLAMAPRAGNAAAAATVAQLGGGDEDAKLAVVECLVQLGPLSAPHGKALARQLESDSARIRSAAVRALVSAGAGLEPSLKQIRSRLFHGSPDVRRAATSALRGLSPQSAAFADAFGKLLHEEHSMADDAIRHRIQILEILAGAASNSEPYLHDIAECLESGDWGVRRAAIECLEDLGEYAHPAAAEVATRMLHQEPDVRRAAVEAMGRLRRHGGAYSNRVPTLLETEEDQDVRFECERAVERLKESGALEVAEERGASPKSSTRMPRMPLG